MDIKIECEFHAKEYDGRPYKIKNQISLKEDKGGYYWLCEGHTSLSTWSANWAVTNSNYFIFCGDKRRLLDYKIDTRSFRFTFNFKEIDIQKLDRVLKFYYCEDKNVIWCVAR